MEPQLHNPTYEDVPIDQIRIPDTHRASDPSTVVALAESISTIGLLEPIGLTSDRTLIYGRDRISAYQYLRRPTIPSLIHSLDALHVGLAEIDENIQRRNLTTLEQARSLARRKTIYESLHPETRAVTTRGGPGRGKKTSDKSSSVSFTKDTSAKTGRSGRTIERFVEIGTNLDDEAGRILAGSPIANSKGQLAKLSRLPPQEQRQMAKRIALGEVRKVEQAVEEHGAAREHEVTKGLRGLSMLVSAMKSLGLHDDYEGHLKSLERALRQANAMDKTKGLAIQASGADRNDMLSDVSSIEAAGRQEEEEMVWTG